MSLELEITKKELEEASRALINLLKSKGNPMMLVCVTETGADLYTAECGIKSAPCENHKEHPLTVKLLGDRNKSL